MSYRVTDAINPRAAAPHAAAPHAVDRRRSTPSRIVTRVADSRIAVLFGTLVRLVVLLVGCLSLNPTAATTAPVERTEEECWGWFDACETSCGGSGVCRVLEQMAFCNLPTSTPSAGCVTALNALCTDVGSALDFTPFEVACLPSSSSQAR